MSVVIWQRCCKHKEGTSGDVNQKRKVKGDVVTSCLFKPSVLHNQLWESFCWLAKSWCFLLAGCRWAAANYADTWLEHFGSKCVWHANAVRKRDSNVLVLHCIDCGFSAVFRVQTRVPFLLRNWISSVLVSVGNRRSRILFLVKVQHHWPPITWILPFEAKIIVPKFSVDLLVTFWWGANLSINLVCDDMVHDCIILQCSCINCFAMESQRQWVSTIDRKSPIFWIDCILWHDETTTVNHGNVDRPNIFFLLWRFVRPGPRKSMIRNMAKNWSCTTCHHLRTRMGDRYFFC